MTKSIKYSKQVVDFIIEQIEVHGKLVATICREFPDKVPSRQSVNKWEQKYPSFAKKLADAYTNYGESLASELDQVSRPEWIYKIKEENPSFSDRDIMALRKDRINVLTKLLATIAPVISGKWASVATSKVEHTGTVETVNVVNYAEMLSKSNDKTALEASKQAEEGLPLTKKH